MRTIQLTLDEDLIKAVDRLTKKLKTTRSAFTREALREAIRKQEVLYLEQKHREGYEKFPVEKDEFSVWENEQAWCD